MRERLRFLLTGLLCAVVLFGFPLLVGAEEPGSGGPYRTILGLESRQVVWIVAQLHLNFAAFVLGVPIFAVIIEVVGTRNKDPRYDRLAHECVKLLSAAFATVAALGGLLAFTLFGLYPGVMRHISGAMHGTYYLYGLVFFVEIFALYFYLYSWRRMASLEPRRPKIARALRVPTWILGTLFIGLAFYLFMWNGSVALESLGTSPQELAEGAPAIKPIPEHYRVFIFVAGAFLLVYGVYAWASSRKSFHIFFGVILNIGGITLMIVANSWGTFMMSPTTFNAAGEFVGDTWGAVSNYLWRPLNLHRLMGNVTFGGFVIGAYAAVRFLATRDKEDRAYYDWMGYIGNFIGMGGLLLLPFAGYYLGRELYSFSPVMGNDAMGGFLSWNFVVQAVLIGLLLVGANFYLWAGMERIEGAERYRPWFKFILAALVLSFLVWVTPRNLPLAASEAAEMGTQYHPVLKYLGLMPAKNAAVNFILLSTYWSFMLYRRANKGEVGSLRQAGVVARIVVPAVLIVTAGIVALWASVIFRMVPADLSLPDSVRPLFHFHAWMLVAHVAVQVLAVGLAYAGRGKVGQAILLGVTALMVAGVFGVSGFYVLKSANPFLRHLAVCQVLLVLVAMVLATALDVALFKGAREIGRIRWGSIGARPQYALVLLCVSVVLTMGLMGYIHSGVRQDWHFYMVVRDTSATPANPSLAEVGWIVALISVIYLMMLAFVFWLGTAFSKDEIGGPKPVAVMGDGSGVELTSTGAIDKAGDGVAADSTGLGSDEGEL